MSEQQGRKAQQRGPKKAEIGGALKKEKPEFYIIVNDKKFDVQNMAKGGRVNLRGGGMCKRGMNKKAYGKNS